MKEIISTVDGRWIILVNGFQWGKGPCDISGCSSDSWPTKNEAARAYRNAARRAENAALRELCGTSARAAREDMGI